MTDGPFRSPPDPPATAVDILKKQVADLQGEVRGLRSALSDRDFTISELKAARVDARAYTWRIFFVCTAVTVTLLGLAHYGAIP